MLGRLLVTAIALSAAGCGASSPATVAGGDPLAAAQHARPELAMVRSRIGSRMAQDELILVTLGVAHDRVLSVEGRAGSHTPLPDVPAAWSPDAHQLAFVQTSGGELRGPRGFRYPREDIFIVDADGSQLRQLTHTGDASNPVWSPDGRQIAFSRARPYISVAQNREGITASIWTIHPDGSDARPLTPTIEGQDDQPGAFSPDERWLAFTRSEATQPVGTIPNTSTVYLLHTSDGTLRKLAAHASRPVFSPDGKWIALASTRDRDGIHQIGEDQEAYAADLYLVDLAGRRWRRLTHTSGIDEDYPSFSPNGARIAYERIDSFANNRISDNYHHTVWEINANGSCPTPIRDDDHADVFWYSPPAWQPGKSLTDDGPLHCRRSATQHRS